MTGRFLLVFTLTTALGLSGTPLWAEGQRTPQRTSQAWTYEEAIRQMRLNPEDVYLQYVALQLARNQGKTQEAFSAIRSLNRQWRGRRSERQVDLFAMFTGALAVQEALQLDAMRVDPSVSAGGAGDARDGHVQVAELAGPQVKSHPWGKMLAAQQLGGKKPKVSPLAMCVPEDQYFVLFRSLSKLLEGVDVGDLWGAHLFKQAAKSAKTQKSSQRLKRQLAMKTDPLTRPF